MKYLFLYENFNFGYEEIKTIKEILLELNDFGYKTIVDYTPYSHIGITKEVFVDIKKNKNTNKDFLIETVLRIKDYMKYMSWTIKYDMCDDDVKSFNYQLVFEKNNELGNYLKKFESIGDLYDKLKSFSGKGDEEIDTQLRKLKSLAALDNLNRLSNGRSISEDFEYYFFDMIDYGWKYSIYGFGYMRDISFRKKLKVENAENEFNYIVSTMSEIRDRLSFNGYTSQFSINFGGIGQQDNNTETHRNDDYKFKGVGVSTDGYFDAIITLTIV